jgi:F-type H+-transporting ATPase subunit O
VTAVRANALEAIYEELNELLKASEKSPTFAEFLKDMSISNKSKVKAVQSLLGELGFSDISTNFLGIVLAFSIELTNSCGN